MKIIDTNKIIIESFEKIGFTLQYVYQKPNDTEEISLTLELNEQDIQKISLFDISTMMKYIISETNNDKDVLFEFTEIIVDFIDNKHVLFVWEE
jgi:hypothetical protein